MTDYGSLCLSYQTYDTEDDTKQRQQQLRGGHSDYCQLLPPKLRVQNEPFSEKKGFILCYAEKEVGL